MGEESIQVYTRRKEKMKRKRKATGRRKRSSRERMVIEN